MTDLMQQARELLAAEYEDSGCRGIAMHYRSKDFIASSGDESIVLRAIAAAISAAPEARPLDEWHEDMGAVTWWRFPVEEAAWIGTPLDSDWPGYHTHWTPHPAIPVMLAARPQGVKDAP